jgi:hypothetical protein
MEARRGQTIPEATVDAGLATLHDPSDSARLADWILDFVRRPRVRNTG